MIDRIGSGMAQTATSIRSAKQTGSVKAQDTSAEEETVVTAEENRNRDRFVSSEASRYGSPDDPAARAAFDKAHGK